MTPIEELTKAVFDEYTSKEETKGIYELEQMLNERLNTMLDQLKAKHKEREKDMFVKGAVYGKLQYSYEKGKLLTDKAEQYYEENHNQKTKQ